MSSQSTVAIVGAGQAGFQVAASLREQRYDGRVVLVGDEPHTPYQCPPLSKGYLLGEVDATQVNLRPDAAMVLEPPGAPQVADGRFAEQRLRGHRER
jgi:3-phenylpropionate/trans-cinnamate dioxygenase ferredoxin reductase component